MFGMDVFLSLFYDTTIMDPLLRRSILKTLAYFDTFDFPLTVEELHRWLWTGPIQTSLVDVRVALDYLLEKKEIEQHTSFYTLPKRGRTIHLRQQAIPLIKEKMAIARRAGKILRYIPYIRGMYVCNTVAGAIPHEKSDIDVFIIIRPGRLWITRAMTTLILGAMRLRRTKTMVHNRICLSFYITEHHINLVDIVSGEPDIYLAYWIDQLVPIYDPQQLLLRIHQQNNWVKKWLPHAMETVSGHDRWSAQESIFSRRIKQAGEFLLNGISGERLEKKSRQWQREKMSANVESLQSFPDSRVIINDSMLKFHENDRRDFFRQRWKDRCFELNVS